MKDTLIFLKMEDELNFIKMEETQFVFKLNNYINLKQIKDDLNILVNGRQ
jgi:hypothetical protein